MARNEEKHYGKLNRLYLMKEREEHEKANPKRPKLDTLYTVEEVQKWLPSIKKDLDFYLKKSQVICYSDAHVQECREKVIKLEKEFKAFVRKIKQLNPSPLDAIPWTNRPYKRKTSISKPEESSSKVFKRIETPILDNEVPDDNRISLPCNINMTLMNLPLSFSSAPQILNQAENQHKSINCSNSLNQYERNSDCTKRQFSLSEAKNLQSESESSEFKNNQLKNCNIVNYDSSDSEDS